MWADYTISLAQIVLALSLLPTVLSKTEKPPLSTSVITSISLFVMSAALFELKAVWGASLTFVNALLWLIISFQKYTLNYKLNN